jgi:DNA polymerase-3 subunit alpha
MIYQEQVMQAAQRLAGFSLAKADLLRRAMGKKIKAEMDAQRAGFIEGAVAHGVDAKQASTIFEQIDKFAGYGFNKSHAAAYALVAWQTAYLKANHPVEFFAATMTYDMGNTDKINLYKQELARVGIALLPPDINRSEADFAVENGAIRYALAGVKNVGAAAMKLLVEERQTNGEFADLADFVARVDSRIANKRQLENLIRAGAFDALDRNRRRLFEGADLIVRLSGSAAGGKDASQPSLFAGDGATARPRLDLPKVDDWPEIERLANEQAAIGFFLSAHPLDAYGTALARVGVVPSGQIKDRLRTAEARKLKLAGILVRKQERTSQRGNRFAFIQFTDKDGPFEIVAFSELLSDARDKLESKQPLLITVEARLEGDEVKMTGQAIEPLDKAVANAVAGLRVHVADTAQLPTLKNVFADGKKGRGRVNIVLAIDASREVEIVLPEAYAISGDMRARIAALPGVTVAEI